MSRRPRDVIAGFLLATGIIGVFLWQVGIQEVAATLARSTLHLTAAAFVIAAVGFGMTGVSWWLVVKDVTRVTFREGIELFYAVQFANGITPLGQLGGEPFIAYILSRETGTPLDETFGAVLAADILNMAPFFTYSLVGGLIFLVVSPITPLMRTVLTAALLLGVTVIVLLTLFWRYQREGVAIVGRCGAWLEQVIARLGLDSRPVLGRINRGYCREKAENFYGILRTVLRQRRRVLQALAVNHASLLLSVVGLYVFLLSLGVNTPLSALSFILPLALLASFLPLPGGLGGIEVALALLLINITGVPASVASGAALLFRLATYWLTLLVGGYLLSQFSISIFAESPGDSTVAV